jgi:YVTN family beta-propeller protein
MKTRTFVSAVTAALVASLPGCVKDPVSALREVPVPSARGVYIINQGNFGRANSSLSYYDLVSFHVYNDVFTAVNGKNLGDVAQAMTIRGSFGYVVVNNSQKIEIIDLATNLNTGTISTGTGSSPGPMAFVNDSLALVTDLFANALIVVNVSGRRVTGTIPVGDNPAGIAIAQGKAYVSNSGFGSGRTVSVISLQSLSVVRTLTVTDNPSGVEITPSGAVYVVCTGAYDFTNPANDTPARIMVIDPFSDVVTDSIYIGGHATDIGIGIDGIGYVPSTTEVFRVDTRVHRVTGVFKEGAYFAVGVEAASGDVYLADPKTFVQPGTVSVFAPNGQLRTQFDVGLIPGAFAFKR